MDSKRNIEKMETINYLLGMLIKSSKECVKSQSRKDSEMLKTRLVECRRKING